MAASKFNIRESIEGDIPTETFRLELAKIKKHNEGILKRVLSERSYVPLCHAARLGRTEIVKILLEFGANTRTIDKQLYWAVHAAAAYDNVEVLKLLLAKDKASITMCNGKGWNPLICALEKTSKNVVTYLLEKHRPECFSATYMAPWIKPETNPMYFAACHELKANSKGERYTNIEVVRFLLQNGCPNNYKGEHLVIHAARAEPLLNPSGEKVLRNLQNLMENSDPSNSDLLKTKQVINKRLSEISSEVIKTNLEQVLNYLIVLEKKLAEKGLSVVE